MKNQFVHLHVHTQYSLLDGQAAIPKLIEKALKDDMPGMAITDHGNMMGVKEYFNYLNKIRGKAKGDITSAQAVLDNPEASAEDKSDARKKLDDAQKILNFKPIFGCEVYCARRKKELKETKEDQSGWHLILLAKNERGYHNLIRLVSRAWVDGLYYRPRTDHEDIELFHEDIICCSACIGGEIPQLILKGQLDEAEKAVLWFKNLFGDDYYLELQRHEVKDPSQRANRETFPLQQQVNAELIKLARKHNIKLICSNDSHFVDEENAEAHDRLICISTAKDVDDPTRMLYTKQEWFKTTAEMAEIFSDIPEALENTLEICSKVEEYSIDHGPIMPNFAIPEDFGTEEEYRRKFNEEMLFDEFTQDENGNVVMSREEGEKKIKKLGGYDKLYRIKLEADYLAKLAYEGAKWRYGDPLDEEIATRIKFELHIMKTMGFPGYFLIVQDYIKAAREQLGVSVGPGRGSAAGSAVAYCLRITDIDPIKYDLLFERFLNPDRISLPDIDVDFDDDGRGKVLQWVTDKYGADRVAHIITYGTMATKSVIKDVGRVQKVPISETNRLVKLIPDHLPEVNGTEPDMNLPNAIAAVRELREAEASPDPKIADTIRYAKMLEGNIRNTGVHACGVIICRDAISDWVPVSTADDKESGGKLLCTQYEGGVIEETGLIKMDFLGLKTLSQIREVCEVIKETLNIDIDIDSISIEDPATYKLYCEGRTIGTFQFESPGMQKYLRELQPSTFEDLIAMNALYRPGPMKYIPDFIRRKHGEEPITYDLPCMERYLKDTYGITVYQEQVMLLSREIAGFTRGESDTLRKAMGKKIIAKLNALHPKFVTGGTANNHNPEVLEKIWKDWEDFASYAFNKSHATCYSWVAYQTAWLKANFPAQFMAAMMSRSLNNMTDITKLLDEAKNMNIPVLGPHVNESRLKFTVNTHGQIRFGMGGVKGVGANVVKAIVDERQKNGQYKDIFDFMERVNIQQVGRKGMESLAYAGAFDGMGIQREQFFAPTGQRSQVFMDVLIDYSQRFQADRAQSINSLFGDEMASAITRPKLPTDYEEWGTIARLNQEKEYVGIYLSGHPLDDYKIVVVKKCNTTAAELADIKTSDRTTVTFAGIVTSLREGISKTGKPYGIAKVEDFTGAGELAMFGDEWAKWQGYIKIGNAIFVTAELKPDKWKPEIKRFNVVKVEWLGDMMETGIKKVTIDIDVNHIDTRFTEELSSFLLDHPGNVELFFRLIDNLNHYQLPMMSKSVKVNLDKAVVDFLEGTSYTVE